ncbi:hypothetical protein RM51_17820 [Chryseobacterium taiwanense]|uniref:Uncharacterized protein n=1 Tax=Chryseobacterium taiwanense TaxID=363331 RepID=A0A0B4D3V7_9FLAO|nr:hypothetical protein RM51_17820 [Chryseobacterium taiwanense]
MVDLLEKNLSDSLNTDIDNDKSEFFEIENQFIGEIEKVNALIDIEKKNNDKKGYKVIYYSDKK